MVLSGVKLNYGLFRDAARGSNWGNVQGTDTYSGRGNVASVSIPVYPRVAGGQLVPPGTYVDTVSTGSRTFTVTAIVPSTCSFTTTVLNFGTYTGVALSGTSSLSVQCTNTTSYKIGINSGSHAGSGSYSWQMAFGASLVPYTLWRDAAHSQKWGGTQGTDTIDGIGNGSVQNVSFYGTVDAGLYVTPGNYTDTVNVILYY